MSGIASKQGTLVCQEVDDPFKTKNIVPTFALCKKIFEEEAGFKR